jgi:hypothetical protein
MGISVTLYPRELNYWKLLTSGCVTLFYNNSMSTAAVIPDIEKAFNTTWHSVLLHMFSELVFSYKSH